MPAVFFAVLIDNKWRILTDDDYQPALSDAGRPIDGGGFIESAGLTADMEARRRNFAHGVSRQAQNDARETYRRRIADAGTLPDAKADADAQQPSDAALNECEQAIVQALRENDALKGRDLARMAGYPYNSGFKMTAAGLRRRRIIGNSPGHGYHLPNRSVNQD